MIHRPLVSRAKPSQASRKNFRQRYDDLEAQRADGVARLHRLSESSKQHPGYKRALKLLNEIYRREKLAQRLAVLHAASWQRARDHDRNAHKQGAHKDPFLLMALRQQRSQKKGPGEW
jgi:hypothetical protein